jgi:streptomycin 3"-adenylyltransferase
MNKILVKHQVSETVSLLQDCLGKNLIGVYLYGSILHGGLQKYSDIDILAVCSKKLSQDYKKRIAHSLLKISGIYLRDSKRCLEVTIINISDINPWQYPPFCEFQYGEWLRDAFESNQQTVYQSQRMADLAMIIAQAKLKSKTLFGVHADKVLLDIPHLDLMRSMVDQIPSLIDGLIDDTRNCLLTLSRIWCSISTNKIGSKTQASDWAMHQLPPELKPILKNANLIYLGKSEDHWSDKISQVNDCARYMVNEIEKIFSSINTHTTDQKIELINDTEL